MRSDSPQWFGERTFRRARQAGLFSVCMLAGLLTAAGCGESATVRVDNETGLTMIGVFITETSLSDPEQVFGGGYNYLGAVHTLGPFQSRPFYVMPGIYNIAVVAPHPDYADCYYFWTEATVILANATTHTFMIDALTPFQLFGAGCPAEG